MIKIVHLSDFHFNNSTKKEWNLHVKKALISKLEGFKAETGISLIAFTGDLIDRGGIEDFKSADEAFENFNNEVIKPILDELNLDNNKFFLIPGNHDIQRNKGSKYVESGLREDLKTRTQISKFIEDHENEDGYEDIERIESYNKFESDFYKDFIGEKKITKFSSSFIIDDTISGKKIGIVCINSSWRCYDDTDKGRLIIGESHLTEHRNFIDKVDFKIGLIHHPLDMLIEVEEHIITSHLQKDFHTLLYGHCHEGNTNIRTGLTGTLIQNMAPSGLNDISSDSRKFSNGFSTIEYDLDTRFVCIRYWRYNNDKEEFVLNTDLGNNNGEFCYEIPFPIADNKSNQVKVILNKIKENHYGKMTELLIDIKNQTENIKSIRHNYILPPIVTTDAIKEDKKESFISLSEIVQASWNIILFGNSETGKTMLLYRLVYEFVEEYNNIQKVPVYFNFEELGNKEIITVIKDYLSCTTSQVNDLIEEEKIVLLIDNLNYKKFNLYNSGFNRLTQFLIDNQKVKIIATAENNLNSIAPIEFVDKCQIPFHKLFIKNLGSKEIKSMMKMWIPEGDSLDIENRVDELVIKFQSFSLPSTPMSVSLFLWSTENHDRKPINHAVLLEIYIDIILQKLDRSNIYRDTFDFTNKLQILAKLANDILDVKNDDGSISASQYLSFVEKYIKSDVAFQYDPNIIAEYFVSRRIFTRTNGRVKFTYSCFLEFFLAKRMEFNSSFKAWILSEERYFNYSKEIDYYTGLVRSDEDLLDEILIRFKKEFSRTDFIFDLMKGKWDKHFIVNLKKESKKEFEPIAKNIKINTIKENRPSQELIDNFNDKRLSKIEDPQNILRKEGAINLEVLLIIMSNVLRNSEGVENKALKKDAYETIVKYCLIWMILYREFIVDYVLKNQKLPPAVPAEVSLISLLKNMPLSVQGGMNKHLSTFKLSPIILEKIKEDNLDRTLTKSDIEKFLSIALYADVQGKDYTKYFKKFIRTIGNNPVRDYSLHKLLEYYYRRTKEGSEKEEEYIDLITELRIKSQSITIQAKERIVKSIKDSKKIFLGSGKN